MKRFEYNADGFSSLDESETGDWVRYEDHAADRAELVAQLEAANKLLEETTDDALKQRVEFWREACQKAEAALEAERADHDEFGQYKRAEALVAQVAELTRERDDWKKTARAGCVSCPQEYDSRLAAEAEVTRLIEALAAERSECNHRRVRAEAAEARVRELTERVSQALTGLRPGSPVREALEEALRAP